jgi:hypothetical protein
MKAPLSDSQIDENGGCDVLDSVGIFNDDWKSYSFDVSTDNMRFDIHGGKNASCDVLGKGTTFPYMP